MPSASRPLVVLSTGVFLVTGLHNLKRMRFALKHWPRIQSDSELGLDAKVTGRRSVAAVQHKKDFWYDSL